MTSMIDELEFTTKQLIFFKNTLDTLERTYALAKSKALLEQLKGYTNQEAREAAVTVQMEEDSKIFLNDLYNVRGTVRELSLKREVLLERLKEKRSNSMSEKL